MKNDIIDYVIDEKDIETNYPDVLCVNCNKKLKYHKTRNALILNVDYFYIPNYHELKYGNIPKYKIVREVVCPINKVNIISKISKSIKILTKKAYICIKSYIIIKAYICILL